MTETMGNGEQIEETGTSAETNIQESRTFTQDEVDAIVKARLVKQSKKYEDIDMGEYRSLKKAQEDKELEARKERGEFEKILQEQKANHDNQIASLKSQLHKELVEGSLLKVAGNRNAVSPEQVASLLRNKVKLGDDGAVYVLNENGEIAYDTDSASPLGVDKLVNGFLDANPHFLRAGPSGSGSETSVGEKSNSDLNIADLDMKIPAHRQKYAEIKKKQFGF
jgi:hypothetical protein